MPALIPTDFTATITWLGVVADSTSDLRAQPLETAFASYAGFEGDCHAGLTRAACVRTTAQHPKGTQIRNVRQLSILSAEQMAEVATVLGLVELDPRWLGASMVIEGIPDFSHVPPSARLQSANGTTIVIDMENRPCVYPAKEIEKDRPGRGKAFVSAASGRRGVTAWIEREGRLSLGDTLRLHVPDQPAWQHR